MFNTNTEAEERGQVGIGTLIVFIALVLVAAIAAGVLINTAGFLQSQAEATGQESTEQVSNSLQTTVVTGITQTDGTGSGLTTIEAGLKLAPGSDPISTSGLTVQVFAEGNSTKRITSDLATSSGNATVTDGSGSAVDVIDESQSYVLLFETDTTFGEFGGTPTDGLPAGNDVIIEITTASGSQTRIEATAPDPISSSNSEVILE